MARGIDPNVALAVARSEGLGGAYVGDRGSSFGIFQLHKGGLAGGGMSVGGLGDMFQRETGRDPRDPSSWRAQIDWSLDYAAKHGWGAWHGWKGTAFAGMSGRMGLGAAGVAGLSMTDARQHSTSTTEVRIGSITVNTQATDADGIARDLGQAIERNSFANQANVGLD